jgi:serine/threonine protein phosphatase PrpC
MATVISCGRQLFPCGFAETMGSRPTMEDAMALVGDFAGSGNFYFAVFDGHGGSDVSKYAANNIHRVFNRQFSSDVTVEQALLESIAEVNEYAVRQWPEQGSTAAILIVIKDLVYTANIGDSRIVLAHPDGTIKALTVDHKATDPTEKDLVLERGGHVIMGRVNGVLALSRSLGDGALGDAITAQPYTTKMRRKDGMLLIIACDGVWDVMDNETAVKIAKEKRSPQLAAAAIRDEALKRGSTDNISVIVVLLTQK